MKQIEEFIFIAKGDTPGSKLPTYKVIDIFTKSDDLEEIKSAVTKAGERLYVSWASVEWTDKQGERIPIDDVIGQQDTLLKRNGPITDSHTNRVVGQTLAYKVMQHPRTQTLGVLHLNKIFNDQDLDNQVWTEIKEGKRTGSSVGGYADGGHMEVDPQTNLLVKVLDGFKQYETASVYAAANPFALNEAVSVVAKGMSVSKEELISTPLKEMIEEHERLVSVLASQEPDALNLELSRQSAELAKYKGMINPGELVNKANVINNEQQTSINKTEVITMDEVQKTEFDNLKKSYEDLKKEFEELKKSIPAKKSEDEKDEKEELEDKEKKKSDNPESPKPEENNQKDTYKAEKIEGLTGKDTPESPVVDDSNDKDVFKKEIAETKKGIEDIKKELLEVKKTIVVSKVETPRPTIEVQKTDNLALEIAQGKVKKEWTDLNAMHKNDAYL